jgi:hypothetical protein
MKESILYPYYLAYIETSSYTKQKKSLLKICETYFLKFCTRMLNDISFKEKINMKYLKYQRSKKINNLLNA